MTNILTTLMPPPVEPTQAPIKLTIIRKTGIAAGQLLKFCDEYPVVVAIDTV